MSDLTPLPRQPFFYGQLTGSISVEPALSNTYRFFLIVPTTWKNTGTANNINNCSGQLRFSTELGRLARVLASNDIQPSLKLLITPVIFPNRLKRVYTPLSLNV